MDRILGANTIDLGGGRRGFRGKDTVAGIPGTELAAMWHNAIQEEIVGLIELAGYVPSNGDFTQFGQMLQSGFLNYGVAGGTANAWTLDAPLVMAAYRAGRRLWIKAPATNTSTTVNCNVDGLGNRRVKRSDGIDPEPGDLVSGRIYPTIDDGANILIMVTLASQIAAGGAPGAVDVIYTTSQIINIPVGITRAYLEVRAPGGGGGYGNGSGGEGGGGGGGGYSAGLFAIPSGGQLTLTIGAGGPGGTSGSQAGSQGGLTSVAVVGGSTLLSATGGSGGQPGPSGSTGSGGSGGGGSGGQLNVAGQSGQGSIKFSGADLVGGGGTGAFGGGAGAPQHNSAANPGAFPGGGGSGGYGVGNGGNGAGGLIRVRW